VRKFYAAEIAKKKRLNLYRRLTESDVIDAVIVKRGKKNLISFASNDYFGLSQNAEVKKAAIASVKDFGVGAGASRYVSGNNSLYAKLEKQIAQMKNCDSSIVFSSGYSCAIGVIPALVSKGDLIVADRLIHSSLIDGAKLSGAFLMRFLHNDIDSARKILEENRRKFSKCLIITESVFSMDGDLGRIDDLLKLAEEFDSILLTDEAHDLFDQKINKQKADNLIRLGTLSKAVGSLGGYVAADEVIIDYLRNFSRSQIYSTALPASILAAAIESLKIIKKTNPSAIAMKNARYFCELMNLPKPESAIIPIILSDSKTTLDVAKKIEKEGFLVGAIRYPTVERNKARLRITISSLHKKSQIEELARIIKAQKL
jgi:8-amino-7-oxononanoate synthase